MHDFTTVDPEEALKIVSELREAAQSEDMLAELFSDYTKADILANQLGIKSAELSWGYEMTGFTMLLRNPGYPISSEAAEKVLDRIDSALEPMTTYLTGEVTLTGDIGWLFAGVLFPLIKRLEEVAGIDILATLAEEAGGEK